MFLSLAVMVFGGCSHPEMAPEKPAAGAEKNCEPETTYVPKDLEDTFAELDRVLSVEVRDELKAGSEEDLAEYHFGLGAWMRNEWGLWADSRLSKHFKDLGIDHPDDMSGIILVSYWRRLHGLDLDLDAQVGWYRDYWENAREPENKLCPKDHSVLTIDVELDDTLPDASIRIRHVGICEQGHTMVHERGMDWREPTEDEWPRIRGEAGGTVRTIGRWKD